jgi:CBS domain-containing protein/ribosome-associated translation inhibitor RaiA
MDISDAVTTEYVAFEPETRIAKVAGAFEDPAVKAVVVEDGGRFRGVVTQRQLLSSHHDPDEKAGSAMRRDPPRIQRTEDVRETARLMLESQLKLLPVFEGETFYGVVTAQDILALVDEHLDVLTIDDVYTRDLISVDPEATLGEVIHTLLDANVSRVPVIEGGSPEGMISLHDLMDFTVRQMNREQGGDAGWIDSHGGEGSAKTARTHGGWGDRAGEQARMLDLPASDVATPGVLTARSNDPLDEAVREMLENDYSSLVVVSEDGTAIGIMTDSDVLRSLTWTGEGRMDFQIFNVDLLDDISRESVAELIEGVVSKDASLDVLETNVVLHEHKESQRGTPLIQATIRLFTDEGRFVATGEEYGAGASIRSAVEKLERTVLDQKEHGRTKKHTPEKRERVEKLLGWWLEL